jgi:pimeloyl-ACP methyl ester carboxylesterase
MRPDMSPVYPNMLILVDARGHGGSDKPHDPAAYSPTAMVGDLLSVLDACGVPKTHFYGHSMGGGIGLQTAKLSPQRLRSSFQIHTRETRWTSWKRSTLPSRSATSGS